MLSLSDRPRVAVILVRARNPNNVGAVARAMHDFGFADLRVVSEYQVPLETARSAIDAEEVIRGAQRFARVAEAVADRTLVLGTTAVGARALDHPVAAVQGLGERVAAHLAESPRHRVALLFGSEKTGMSNDELSHCHGLVTIPMAEHAETRHPSMNLGQAAAVCLYELVRDAAVASLPGPGNAEAASAAALERLRALVAEVLEASGYARRYSVTADGPRVRRLLLRSAPPARDVPAWMGLWRQVLWRLRGGDGAAETTAEQSRPA